MPFPRMRHGSARALWIGATIAMLAPAGCESSALQWSEPIALSAGTADVRLEVDARGRARLVRGATAAVQPPPGIGICESSVRMVRQLDGTLVAVFWAVRPDSSAVLESALSSDDGLHWRAAIAIESGDVSTAGCTRPAPTVAASAGFVHVAYSARGRDGAGLFYAHSMTRGKSYESPVAIIYADRLTRAAVAADRGLVAVAYEDPNGPAPQIALALSRSWGHSFDDRSRVSAGSGSASKPLVSVTEHQIAVSWIERPRMDADDAAGARIVRVARAS